MIKKLFIFINSWKYINLEKNDYKIIIFGSEAKSQLNFFKKNYYYLDPMRENIFNFKLILPGLLSFFNCLFTKPFKVLKILKFILPIIIILGLIKSKKIKKIFTLVDYNIWPIIFKELLGDKIYIITLQNSSRIYPMNRVRVANKFDEYLVWNRFNENEKKEIKQTKLKEFGALKSYIVLNKNRLWNEINVKPNQSKDFKKNLVLISTLTSECKIFFDKFLREKNFEDYSSILDDLEKEALKNKFKKDNYKHLDNKNYLYGKIPALIFHYQSIEFFKMCLFLRNYIEKEKLNFTICERWRPGDKMYEEERKIFYKIFGKVKFLNKDVYEKIEFITKEKNCVYITNISNLGRECLALKRKAFFFSTILHFYNPDFFDKDSKLFSINNSLEEFASKLNNLFELNDQEFSEVLKTLKDTVTSCELTEDRFKYLTDLTGLQPN